jgi:hypothetical protein
VHRVYLTGRTVYIRTPLPAKYDIYIQCVSYSAGVCVATESDTSMPRLTAYLRLVQSSAVKPPYNHPAIITTQII